MNTQKPILLTYDDLARLLRVRSDELRKMVENGDVPAPRRIGRCVRFVMSEVEARMPGLPTDGIAWREDGDPYVTIAGRAVALQSIQRRHKRQSPRPRVTVEAAMFRGITPAEDVVSARRFSADDPARLP